MSLIWKFDLCEVDWNELSELYRIAPLGSKSPSFLQTVFENSRYTCFVYDSGLLVGVGRVLSDGLDCAYVADIAVHPEYQASGIGSAIVEELVARSKEHRKIILYAAPGKESFYAKLGFKRMNTAMAIFQNEAEMMSMGTLSEP